MNKNESYIYTSVYGQELHFAIVDTCSNVNSFIRSVPYIVPWAAIGVIGPATTEQARLAAVLFNQNVISYAALSQAFDNRNSYPRLYRTVPPYSVQAKVILDILNFFNWTYISAVHSTGEDWKQGIDSMLKQFKKQGGCLGMQQIIPASATRLDYEEIIKELDRTPGVKVVVLLTSSKDTDELLSVAHQLKFNNVTWVSSTGGISNEAVDVTKTAQDVLFLRYKISNSNSEYFKEFENYFMNLNVKTNNYTWFQEFWSEVFQCNVEKVRDKSTDCTGNERLNSTKLSINAHGIEPVFYAIHSLLCSAREILYYYLNLPLYYLQFYYQMPGKNFNCPQLSHSVPFNTQGYYDRPVEIMMYDERKFVKVGEWSRNSSGEAGRLLWTSHEYVAWNRIKKATSSCTSACKQNEIGLISENRCCFTCKSCSKDEFVTNNTCISCDEKEIADISSKLCKPMPMTYMFKMKLPTYFSVSLSLAGVACNTAVVAILIKHRKTRIVKATSIELTSFILLALYICFFSPLIYLSKPTVATCGLQRSIVGISLTSCYTPLVLKITRIYRIFTAARSSVKKPVLVSPRAQITICLALIILQVTVSAMLAVVEPPSNMEIVLKKREIAVMCESSTLKVIFNLIPALALMAVCTRFAYKTRNFPSNYNEAFSIFTAMFTSCFIWGIFITLIIFLEMDKEKVFALWFIIANFTSVIGFVTLFALFGPLVRKLCMPHDVEPSPQMLSTHLDGVLDSLAMTRVAHKIEIDIPGTIKEETEGGKDAVSRNRMSASTRDASTNT